MICKYRTYCTVHIVPTVHTGHTARSVHTGPYRIVPYCAQKLDRKMQSHISPKCKIPICLMWNLVQFCMGHWTGSATWYRPHESDCQFLNVALTSQELSSVVYCQSPIPSKVGCLGTRCIRPYLHTCMRPHQASKAMQSKTGTGSTARTASNQSK